MSDFDSKDAATASCSTITARFSAAALAAAPSRSGVMAYFKAKCLQVSPSGSDSAAQGVRALGLGVPVTERMASASDRAASAYPSQGLAFRSNWGALLTVNPFGSKPRRTFFQ